MLVFLQMASSDYNSDQSTDYSPDSSSPPHRQRWQMMLKKEENKMLKIFSFRWIVNVDIPFPALPASPRTSQTIVCDAPQPILWAQVWKGKKYRWLVFYIHVTFSGQAQYPGQNRRRAVVLCEYRRKSVSEVTFLFFFFKNNILNVNVQVSLGKNSVVTVVEGSPTAEWWRVETDQGVQVSVVRIKINIIEIIDAIWELIFWKLTRVSTRPVSWGRWARKVNRLGSTILKIFC